MLVEIFSIKICVKEIRILLNFGSNSLTNILDTNILETALGKFVNHLGDANEEGVVVHWVWIWGDLMILLQISNGRIDKAWFGNFDVGTESRRTEKDGGC